MEKRKKKLSANSHRGSLEKKCVQSFGATTSRKRAIGPARGIFRLDGSLWSPLVLAHPVLKIKIFSLDLVVPVEKSVPNALFNRC